jgi:tripartite-type tricarboxylate transporter receptor subunit TctC
VQLARAAEFYAGKSMEIIVPFTEGGAADVTTRFLAPFLMKHLPGKPQINILNLGGGGSILGANQFQKAGKSDGPLILSTTSSSASCSRRVRASDGCSSPMSQG